MADKKISALTASSTPLAGTEVLPIVQSGSTVKVAVSDLTAGRAVAMGSGSVIGNGSAYSNLTLNSSSAGGFDLNIQTASSGRWVVAKTATTEDLYIYRYNDAGGYAGNPLQISRSNGNVRIENNLVVGTSGNGIDFSATPGTGTSELFADYEEGTWTPTVAAAIGSYTTVTGQAGTYTKVGRQVTLKWYFVVTNKGTGLGAVNISNLPFASNASTGNYYAGCGYDTSAGVAQIAAMTATTSIDVLKYDGTDPIIITRGQVGQITYFV